MLVYDDDGFSQGYGHIKETFRSLTEGAILEPYMSDQDFRTSNQDNGIGYILYVFDIRYQKNLESAQPIKVKVIFSENFPAGMYGYTLVLTKKLVSISSDCQRHFDLI